MTSLLFDFADPGAVALWRPTNAAVMGEISTRQLRQIGLMTADRQPGSFALAIRSIAVESA